jgi:hypothetical protein
LSGNKIVYEKYYSGNYLRKVVHNFPMIKADLVRITVKKTNGDKLARIFEIRCYNEASSL